MKKILINTGLILGLFTILFLNGCTEKIDPVVKDLSFSRAFTPIGLTAVISNVTTVTLTWDVQKNVDHFVLEIYQGTDFVSSSMIYTTSISGDLTTYSYVLPAGDTQFSARLKAVSSMDGVDESKWINVSFKSAPENLFLGYTSKMTGLNTCTVKWKPGITATALLFVKGTNQTSYPLTSGELTAGSKDLTGITNGTYEVRLMNGTFVRGKTSLFLEGNVLLASGGDLVAAIAAASPGNVILLAQGGTFAVPANTVIDKSIKIRAVNYESQPVIYPAAGASNTAPLLLIGATLTSTDSIVFQNVTITGNISNTSSGTTNMVTGVYDQGTSNPCNVGLLGFSGCILRNFGRHLVRLRGTATQLVNTIKIDNCILFDYAFGSNYGVINANAATATINNMSITGSTINFISAEIINYQAGTACQGITIANCTFNQVAMGSSRYLINLTNTTGTGTVTVSNCIFGTTAATATGIKPNTMTMSISGSYYTSDFNDGTTFPIKSYLTPYSGASAALWVNPVMAATNDDRIIVKDFHFLDGTFAGRSASGDPRWRP